ncbi:MAG: hypothetical protein JW991_00660 [Candidatus Pacebacteria bacterium]|nr:hypothetical protein [Candidatus Paceibacterota bacterium]
MATLTEVTFYTRKVIRWALYGLIIFVVFVLLSRVGVQVWKRFNPPKPPQPTLSFGVLPPIKFPPAEPVPELSFELETIEGKLPGMPIMAKVHFISKKIYSYLTMERAREIARGVGFNGEPIQIPETSETLFQWKSEIEGIPTSFTMDIIDQTFAYAYDFQKNQSLLESRRALTNQDALIAIQSFLRQASSLPEDVRRGPANYVYFRYQAPNLIPALSLYETDFIKVTLLRENINDLEVLPPNPYNGNISALISRVTSRRVLDLNYYYFPVDREVWGTYPLKDITRAWEELKSGQGYVANLGDNQAGEIKIRKVKLAYFDPPEHQPYLQPIYVFEGDKKFIAYVPAIKAEHLAR